MSSFLFNRNNSIACLRAKAQEHQARLLNSGLFLQVRSFAGLQSPTASSSASLSPQSQGNLFQNGGNNSEKLHEEPALSDRQFAYGSMKRENTTTPTHQQRVNNNNDIFFHGEQHQQPMLKVEPISTLASAGAEFSRIQTDSPVTSIFPN